MTSDTPELQAIQGFQERLGRLERQNRALKFVVGAVLVFLLVAQYKERKGGSRLVATELVLNDTNGQEQAHLSARDGYGQLTVSGYGGSIVADPTGIHIYEHDSPVVELGGVGALDPTLQLWGKGKDSHRSIRISAVHDPKLQITDESGFSAVIGSTDLETTRTGEKHKTSAASLVLFGKDGKVLWSAP